VIRAAAASLLIGHDAQDVRRIRLQHIDNNHSNAGAKDSQTPCPGIAAHRRIRPGTGRAGQVITHTSTAGRPPGALSTGK
jgi:hypothetical protein